EQVGAAPAASDAEQPIQGSFSSSNEEAILAAILTVGEQVAGTGSETYVRTFTDTAGEPVAGVACYVTSDAAGGVRITGKQFTNSFGQVAFSLDPGTYYIWATHSHVTFPQPITITVADV